MMSVHIVGIPVEIRKENLWDVRPYRYRYWGVGGRLWFLLEALNCHLYFRRPKALSTGELGLQSTVQKLMSIRVL